MPGSPPRCRAPTWPSPADASRGSGRRWGEPARGPRHPGRGAPRRRTRGRPRPALRPGRRGSTVPRAPTRRRRARASAARRGPAAPPAGLGVPERHPAVATLHVAGPRQRLRRIGPARHPGPSPGQRGDGELPGVARLPLQHAWRSARRPGSSRRRRRGCPSAGRGRRPPTAPVSRGRASTRGCARRRRRRERRPPRCGR